MPPEPFAVHSVPFDSSIAMEQMGTKTKFWFSRDDETWLFKAARTGTGEHWAEVIAAGLASLLGLPRAHYELASWQNEDGVITPGVVTRNFVPEGFDLVHGNELLAQRDPSYPPAGKRYVRTRRHTIDAVKAVIGGEGVGLPIGWVQLPGIETSVDVFGGYLLLDALIGNTDRHHENWALVIDPGHGLRHLAPTYDHASSLGAHLLDAERRERLESKDAGYRVEGYVKKSDARSTLYVNDGEAPALSLLDAFQAWAGDSDAWLARLESIQDAQMEELIARVPASEITGPARAFAREMLRVNKGRILGVR